MGTETEQNQQTKCVWKESERQVLEKQPELDNVEQQLVLGTLGLQVTYLFCTHSIQHPAYTPIKE